MLVVKATPPTSGVVPILVPIPGPVVMVVFATTPLVIVPMVVMSVHNLPVVRVITTGQIIEAMVVVS